jgi:hypothetical protein
LIAPIEKMRVRANRIESVFGGVMVREQAIGFWVRAAAPDFAWRIVVVEESRHQISFSPIKAPASSAPRGSFALCGGVNFSIIKEWNCTEPTFWAAKRAARAARRFTA